METHSPLTAAMRSDRTAATAASDAPSSLGAPATIDLACGICGEQPRTGEALSRHLGDEHADQLVESYLVVPSEVAA